MMGGCDAAPSPAYSKTKCNTLKRSIKFQYSLRHLSRGNLVC